MNVNETHIKICLNLIEDKLNWGSGKNWTTKDFKHLSEKIQKDTKVTLSVATLKRIWGKISYSSKPTITTLDALAQFIGFENWRSFENDQRNKSKLQPRRKSQALSFVPIGSLTKLGVLTAFLFLWGWSQFNASENRLEPLVFTDYQFSSKKWLGKEFPTL